jgi:hypothetical protein
MVLPARGADPLKCGTRDLEEHLATLMTGLTGAKVDRGFASAN